MDMYRTLYEFSKQLQDDRELERLPRWILEQLAGHTGSERGLIVTRENGDFLERFHIHFHKEHRKEEHYRFCRSLVRDCIRKAAPIFTLSVAQDSRFKENVSARELGEVSILVTPLIAEGEVQGVVYLEKAAGADPFSEEERELVSEMIGLAALHLHRALERESLREFKAGLERDLFANYDFGGLIGRHPKMMRLLDQVIRIADSDATVLIQGETGTGKELIARALYLNSKRKQRPFITLHCGALPETLFEAELFGHKRGAFTGAVRDRRGRIAQADGGTLFIDEVAEMPMSVQAKLLRFFQFGEFQRIGEDRVEKVDVRILTATHRDLAEMVRQGAFREDLYYRLKVVTLTLPPLRERRSDIPPLIESFLKKHWKREASPILSAAVLDLLQRYPYPGNIRELNHIIERLCLLARDRQITLSLLPEEVLSSTNGGIAEPESERPPHQLLTNGDLKHARKKAVDQAVRKVELAFLENLMQRHSGKVSAAARAAGMQVTYFHKLLRKHGMGAGARRK